MVLFPFPTPPPCTVFAKLAMEEALGDQVERYINPPNLQFVATTILFGLRYRTATLTSARDAVLKEQLLMRGLVSKALNWHRPVLNGRNRLISLTLTPP